MDVGSRVPTVGALGDAGAITEQAVEHTGCTVCRERRTTYKNVLVS